MDHAEEYAHHVLNDPENRFFIEDEIVDFIDYERYGRYKMEEDGVRETGQGWLIRPDDPFPPELEQRLEPEQQPEPYMEPTMEL